VSAATIGAQMPNEITLDDVAAMSAAGMRRYWLVGNDKNNAVEMLTLTDQGYRVEREVSSLNWLLNEPAPPLH
jgi:hypothetical protein